MLNAFWNDLRYSLRSLRANRVLTAAVILSLAFGIGLNVAIFTFMNALFLRPLPAVREPGRVIILFTRNASSPAFFPVSYWNYQDYRRINRSCASLAAYQMFRAGLLVAGQAEQVNGEIVSANYFDVLGAAPALGRTFLASEDDLGSPVPVAVISYGLWERRFGHSPAVLGTKLLIDGQPFAVVGVARRGYTGTSAAVQADLWVPTAMYRTVFPFPQLFLQRSAQVLHPLGRLRPGVSPRAADAEFKLIADRLARQYPDDNRGQTAAVYALPDAVLPPTFRPAFQKAGLLLMGAAGLLLLMSCVNVANLLMAKSMTRSREMAVRLSLGAPRRRLLRQLLLESLLLALAGGAASLLVAAWSRDVLWRFRPPFLEHSPLTLAIDPTVLAFTLGLSILTGLVFGLLPALQSTRPDILSLLKDSNVPLARSAAPVTTRGLLLAVQVCLCTLSLSCTVFFLRSLYNAEHLDPGFDVADVVTVSFDFKYQGYDEDGGRRFEQRLLEKARSLPFVESAAVAENRLLGGFRLWENVYPKGRSSSYREGGVYSGSTLAGPGYFHTVGIALLRGRDFAATDTKTSAPVAIINETMAKKLFPGEDPVGRALLLEGEKAPVAIIGVAKNSNYTTLGEEVLPFLYLSLVQRYSSRVTLHARITGNPGPAIDRLKRETQALDPAMPLLEVRSIPAVIAGSLWVHTLSTVLLAIFSAIALALGSIGIYGVTAHFVDRRSREIGVRLALGARKGGVVLLVIVQNAAAVALGVAGGLAAALLAKRVLAGFLFPSRSPAQDLLLLPATALLLAGAALCASLVPALRAARIDPAASLRTE